MERRLAITYIVSATTTFGVACVTIAIAGGGLFASAAAPQAAGANQIEVVDDYIVIHSSSTALATIDTTLVPVDLGPAPAPASRSQIAPASAPAAAPAAGESPVSEVTPNLDPHPAQPEDAVAPSEPAPSPTPEAPAAPAVSSAPAPSPSATVTPNDPPAAEPPAPAPTPTTPPTTAPAARPPIPEGCRDPRFRNGTWRCDDD